MGTQGITKICEMVKVRMLLFYIHKTYCNDIACIKQSQFMQEGSNTDLTERLLNSSGKYIRTAIGLLIGY